MSDIVFLAALVPIMMAGLKKTELALAALLVIEIVRPHNLTYGILSSIPLSAIGFGWVVISIFINLKSIKFPRPAFPLILTIVFLGWITITTQNAMFPYQAAFLWDAAFKNILVLVLSFFCIKNRKQLDFIILIISICLVYFIYSAGIKTLLGGGGYKVDLITTAYGRGSHSLSESSTLSAAVIMYIPLALYCISSEFSIEVNNKLKLLLKIGILLAIPAMIGTGARTGLICLLFLATYYIAFSKNRFKILIPLIVFLPIGYQLAPEEWTSRMSTLNSAEEDSSAMGRVVVWKWTLDFVKENPNGGGFRAFMANASELHSYYDSGNRIHYSESGKAFHNAYIQVLGEHGYFGFTIYLAMFITSIILNIKAKRKETSESLILALLVFTVGSMFIGVAYLIWQYLFLVLSHFNYQYREQR